MGKQVRHIVRSNIRGWNPTGEKSKEKNLKPGDIVVVDVDSDEVKPYLREGVLEPAAAEGVETEKPVDETEIEVDPNAGKESDADADAAAKAAAAAKGKK